MLNRGKTSSIHAVKRKQILSIIIILILSRSLPCCSALTCQRRSVQTDRLTTSYIIIMDKHNQHTYTIRCAQCSLLCTYYKDVRQILLIIIIVLFKLYNISFVHEKFIIIIFARSILFFTFSRASHSQQYGKSTYLSQNTNHLHMYLYSLHTTLKPDFIFETTICR